ncbi:hypothetical protein K438DRAFT_1770675 [Mycena galopus ATCC 62051]|nr:hypothetical protein K438DRAFT_1770675 [Mycena galopus ATCC 62051]
MLSDMNSEVIIILVLDGKQRKVGEDMRNYWSAEHSSLIMWIPRINVVTTRARLLAVGSTAVRTVVPKIRQQSGIVAVLRNTARANKDAAKTVTSTLPTPPAPLSGDTSSQDRDRLRSSQRLTMDMAITWVGNLERHLTPLCIDVKVFRVQFQRRYQTTSRSEKTSPKPRTEPLQRGKACLNCRHLKIRCDGVRPVCGPCTRVPKDDGSQVKELENPGNVPPSVTLTRPNSTGQTASGSSPIWDRRSPSSPGSESAGGSSFVSSPDSDHSLLAEMDPGTSVCHDTNAVGRVPATCISVWLFHASGRFRASALLQLPLGHPARPSPAVLCAAYLWGIHLSRSEPLVSYEAVFIRRAQQHISTELSESAHPIHRIHTIQAHVLLATYFLRNKHFLEAEFHTNGSATLALGYHLHKIRSSRPSSPPLIGASAFTEVFPDPPRDDVEEGERIRGFWAVVCNQNNLITTLRTANNLGILDSPNLSIDTPFPLDIEEYELGMLPRDFRGSDTVRNFVAGGIAGPTSIFALKIQATVLLQQAAQLARKWSPVMQPQAVAAYRNASAWLDARLQQFSVGTRPSTNITTVARRPHASPLIQLHKNDADASTKCINAARAIVVALGDTNVPDFQCGGPAVGTLLLLACQVSIREIERIRYFRTSLGSTLNVEVVSNHEEAGLLLDLQNGLTTMAIYAIDSPLVPQVELETSRVVFNIQPQLVQMTPNLLKKFLDSA